MNGGKVGEVGRFGKRAKEYGVLLEFNCENYKLMLN
jgi:hypothetical protein